MLNERLFLRQSEKATFILFSYTMDIFIAILIARATALVKFTPCQLLPGNIKEAHASILTTTGTTCSNNTSWFSGESCPDRHLRNSIYVICQAEHSVYPISIASISNLGS